MGGGGGGGGGGVCSMASLSRGWKSSMMLVLGFGLLLRFMVGLHSYSGKGTPPKYGDYEAQRHWMEITIHTPIIDWYRNTSVNDLSHWGLDYPPLTAYQSWLYGKVIDYFDPQSLELLASHGYESPSSKLLLRWSVIFSDLLIYFPAIIAFTCVYYPKWKVKELYWVITMALIQPALLLIDHGHFQYNSISLGLAVGAVAGIFSGYEIFGSFLFCLSINHKHMNLYYAPAFFGHLLGRCLRRRRPFIEIARLAMAVICTFALIWAPFLLQSKDVALGVVSRLAPFSRGLYEDHVANFWCTSSLLIKWKSLFTIPTLARIAGISTAMAVLPGMIQQIKSPSKRGLLYAMLNSSFGFFFFAFQVHEKSILLPLLPASLLALDHPVLFRWFTPMAAFSMFPLLRRDGLSIAYFATTTLFLCLSKPPRDATCLVERPSTSAKLPLCLDRLRFLLDPRVVKSLAMASALGALLLHLGAVFVPAPYRYPYIHAALMTAYSFLHFAVIAIFSNCLQWLEPTDLIINPDDVADIAITSNDVADVLSSRSGKAGTTERQRAIIKRKRKTE